MKKLEYQPWRYWFFVGALILFFCLLLVRLIDLQLFRGSIFSRLSDNNRFFDQDLLAPRGIFMDRFGAPLVVNKKQYLLAEDDGLFAKTTNIDKRSALSYLATDSTKISSQFYRQYLYPKSMAHVLGYVGAISSEELENYPDWPYSKQIGKSGLELVFNQELKGIDGTRTYEIDALGNKQRVVSEQLPVPGRDVITSIDPFLSEVAYNSLGDVKGGVIISDVRTGQVLGMVNRPTFDLNYLSQLNLEIEENSARRETVSSWFSDEDLPFFNRMISGLYPPGSTFKLVTAMVGLENGVIDASTTVNDEGSLKVGEYEFGNWYFRQYGKVEGEINLQRSIARSNDIFFYKVAEWVGADQLARMARLFGFGTPAKIELPVNVSGTVPTPEWKEQVIGESWFLGNTYHLGIGQGNLLVTPLQVQQMTQTMANRGVRCDSSLIKSNQAECTQIGLNDDYIALVLKGMVDACSPGGTSYEFFSRNERLLAEIDSSSVFTLLDQGVAACKTGTAEFGGQDSNGYRKTHGWFTVVVSPRFDQVQIDDELLSEEELATPSAKVGDEKTKSEWQSWLTKVRSRGFPDKIAITVLVESSDLVPYREGSKDAAPVAKKILEWMETGKIPIIERATEIESE